MSGATVVVGATASLGVALCRLLAAEKRALLLVGRDEQALRTLADDLRIRGAAGVRILVFDMLKDAVTAEWMDSWGDHASLFMLTGDMGGGERDDADAIRRAALVNYVVPAQILAAAALRMEARGGGEIVAVSSVAGDRGRQSNYLYGSAKAGLTAFASGLRNRYARSGVHVMTVRPGFVDTPMTFTLDSPLIARREKVAKAILNALRRRRDSVYVPWFWRWIMWVIRNIPERLFKRMKL